MNNNQRSEEPRQAKRECHAGNPDSDEVSNSTQQSISATTSSPWTPAEPLEFPAISSVEIAGSPQSAQDAGSQEKERGKTGAAVIKIMLPAKTAFFDDILRADRAGVYPCAKPKGVAAQDNQSSLDRDQS